MSKIKFSTSKGFLVSHRSYVHILFTDLFAEIHVCEFLGVFLAFKNGVSKIGKV